MILGKTIRRRTVGFLVSGLLIPTSALVSSCRQVDPTATASGPPPVPIQTETLSSGIIEDSSEFVGNLEAVSRVEVRPEVPGQIQSILVEPGQPVAAGQSVLVLQPAQTAPQLENAQAAIALAQASRTTAVQQLRVAEAQRNTAASNLELQRVNFERAEFLIGEGAIGQFDYDRALFNYESAQNSLDAAEDQVRAAQAAIAQADASIQQAQAQANAARVDADFRNITAPIDGIMGDIPVNPGDVVNAGQAIAVIAQNGLLDLRIAVPSNRSDQLRQGLTVELIDPNTGESLANGSINFISPTVDATAQSILTRARFTNVNDNLRDGQYVQARIIWDTQPGLLIPTTAISRISGQDFVFLVEDTTTDNGEPQTVVSLNPVELGAIQGDRYQVRGGLETGDRIATTNILRLRDGTPVQPE
jgi:RND family efflux transporter MFP subunit